MTDESDDLDVGALGRGIRRRREALGLTVYALAGRAGFKGEYLQRLEQGRVSRPGLGIVARLARTLGVTVDDLLADAGVGSTMPLPAEIASLYRRLTVGERGVVLTLMEALMRMRSEQARMHRIGEETELYPLEPMAAYDRAIRENADGEGDA